MKTPLLLTCFGTALIIAFAASWRVSVPSSIPISQKQPSISTTLPVESLQPSSASKARIQRTDRSLSEITAELKAATLRTQKASLCDELIALGTDEAVQVWSDAVHAETDTLTRLHMAAALDALSTGNGLELVTSALAFASDETVLEAVNRTISRSATADTISHLVELATGSELRSGQQQRALAVLEQITNSYATDGLAQAALNPHTEVRRAAAASLASMDSPEAAQALLNVLAQLPTEALIERSTLRHHLSQMPAAASLLSASGDPLLTALAQ
jgi:HEAT repeat protein